MSIFTRKDRTKPLPPPEGYKWEIRETAMRNLSGGTVFALELYPITPQKRGKKGDLLLPLMARWCGYFERDTEILAASKDALDSYEKTLQNEAFKAKIRAIPLG